MLSNLPHHILIHLSPVRKLRRLRAIMVFFCVVAGLCCCAVKVAAEWRIDLESKTVDAGETAVSLAITAYWDEAMMALSLPLVVREIDPGAFWTGVLPYDTLADAFNHPHAHGVAWSWASPWAALVEEVVPAAGILPENYCDETFDATYDGVSPDHLAINVAGTLAGAPPQPLGRVILTLTFDIGEQAGRFEFDTACYSQAVQTILMVDENLPPVDHGPGGSGEVTFNKGVITVVGAGGILENDEAGSRTWTLAQNFPNPFNTNTLIRFSLPRAGHARLDIFDILGRKIVGLVDQSLPAGIHQVTWNGKNDRDEEVGSGLYFYQLAVEDWSAMNKILLLK
jgi:hypothetical protein